MTGPVMTPIDSLLADHPRVDLGHWPTPLEPCRRLQAEIGGPLIWLKRDDCSGLAFGGNKTRKLEFLLGEAMDRGATGVVTFGAVQSNHARQTAAACAHVGVPCDLVLTDAVDRPTDAYRSSGNRLLDDVLGATVHVVADNGAAIERAAELAEADSGRYFIDPGGSSTTGVLGYVAAAAELAAQLDAAEVKPDSLVVASSTGGTAAGLVLGLAVVGAEVPVTAVAVYADAAHTSAVIDHLLIESADHLGLEPPSPGGWRVDGSALGDGYGIETPESHAALLALARAEGVLLDPVYTAKAFGALLAESRHLDPGLDVIFLHTGGQPGVFAYADAFS
jgi:D-cysteine desulfhydrase family pyridoxal phosphate-dependent enzyme